jgi:hypothetical protein
MYDLILGKRKRQRLGSGSESDNEAGPSKRAVLSDSESDGEGGSKKTPASPKPDGEEAPEQAEGEPGKDQAAAPESTQVVPDVSDSDSDTGVNDNRRLVV